MKKIDVKNISMNRFSNKRILITGGTSGIGLAGAKRIALEGGEVVVTGFNEHHGEEAKQQLPLGTVILKNDVSDPEAAVKLAENVKALGKLDGLWFNAGFAAVSSIEEVDAKFFDSMMAVNVRGPVLQIAQLSALLNDGASVVLTSSTAAYESTEMASVYAATKGAIISMARCWASYLAKRNIRVNVIVPGAINTNFRNFMADEVKHGFEEMILKKVPLNRVGSPEEAAAVALFLLSDDSSYVTASQYFVDGGLVMR